jgi:hypothetical protein
MIKAYLLLLALGCSEPHVENYTKTWSKLDYQNLNIAIKRCPELYPNSPCLKRFIKKGERNYWAICSRSN